MKKEKKTKSYAFTIQGVEYRYFNWKYQPPFKNRDILETAVILSTEKYESLSDHDKEAHVEITPLEYQILKYGNKGNTPGNNNPAGKQNSKRGDRNRKSPHSANGQRSDISPGESKRKSTVKNIK